VGKIINYTIPSDKDPMGHAIRDYMESKKPGMIKVFSSQFDEDHIPVKHLFRNYNALSPIEKTALDQSKGRVLDVGAGSGCHSLILQDKGYDVTAIDISPLSVEVMEKRGVKNVKLTNIFDERFCDTFDTILFLMNGSGIIGRLENMPAFFQRMKQLLNPGGSIYMDSSDLCYLYEDEDGSFLVDLNAEYYGQVDFRMEYNDIKGDTFDWLYIDFETLSLYANDNGFKAELIREGKHYDYLSRLSIK